jgi:hypothetical protein
MNAESFNVLDIYSYHRHQNEKRIVAYDMIKSRCYRRIKNAYIRKYYELFYEVEEYIDGQPLYNIDHVIAKLIKSLRDNGFAVSYFPPRFLHISWKLNDVQRGVDRMKDAQHNLLQSMNMPIASRYSPMMENDARIPKPQQPHPLQQLQPLPKQLQQPSLNPLHFHPPSPLPQQPHPLSLQPSPLPQPNPSQPVQNTMRDAMPSLDWSKQEHRPLPVPPRIMPVLQPPSPQIEEPTNTSVVAQLKLKSITKYKPTGKIVLDLSE